jgi:hypothetical protein
MIPLPRVVKHTESRKMDARSWESGGRNYSLVSIVSVLQDEKILETGYTTI